MSQHVLKQPGGYAYLIYDQSIFDSNKLSRGYYKDGYSVKAENLDELAQKIKVPAKTLKATFAAYKKAYDMQKDTAFGRPEMVIALDKAPYYAAQITPGIHHTMGGLTINTKAEVQSKAGKSMRQPTPRLTKQALVRTAGGVREPYGAETRCRSSVSVFLMPD